GHTEQHRVAAPEDGVAVDDRSEVAEARVVPALGHPVVDAERQRAHGGAEQGEAERDSVTAGTRTHRARGRSLTGGVIACKSRQPPRRSRAQNWHVGRSSVSERPKLSPPSPNVSKIGVLCPFGVTM